MSTSDPRGPIRAVVAVEPRPDVTLVLLDCGHQRHANQIYTYRIGDAYRCLECRKEALRAAGAP